MSLCDTCETVSHCARHGCIPLTGSLHAAMDRQLREVGEGLQDLHRPPRRTTRSCAALGVCQHREPACGDCLPPIAAATANSDGSPAQADPAWSWIDRLRAPAMWALLLSGSAAATVLVLLAFTRGSLCAA